MTQQNFVTLPREVVEQMLVFMHNKSNIKQGCIGDYIDLETKLAAALTEHIQPAQGEPTSVDYALGYAEGFNDACKPSNAEQFYE